MLFRSHLVSYLGSKMRSPKTEVIHGDKQRYLGELQYRFNRRFDLKRILPRLLVAAVLTPAKPRRILAEGLTETCH